MPIPLLTSFAWKRQLWDDGRFLLPVLLGCVAAGLAANALRSDPLPWFQLPEEDVRLARRVAGENTVELTGRVEPEELGIGEVREWQAGGGVCLVDARDGVWFELGHMPGARSLPRREFAGRYAAFAAEVGRETPLVVYCSGPDCEDSGVVARALMRLGYLQVAVYSGGWQEWRDAGKYP